VILCARAREAVAIEAGDGEEERNSVNREHRISGRFGSLGARRRSFLLSESFSCAESDDPPAW
jgi:hypothetical protein